MFQLHLPEADLRADVEAALAVQRPAGSVSRFPAMPRAMLTLAPPEGGAAAVRFHALGTQPAVHHHAQPVQALGLVLMPVVAARLLGPRVGALVDASLPWLEITGPAESAPLQAALQRAGDDAARLAALQASLRRTLAARPQRTEASRQAQLQQLVDAVALQGAQAAAVMGCGRRQLERRCQAWLGLAPQQLHRLARFQAALAQALRTGRPPSADDALAAGFYDQSHLGREARDLAGAPWRTLLGAAHAGAEWWPLAVPVAQARGALRHHR